MKLWIKFTAALAFALTLAASNQLSAGEFRAPSNSYPGSYGYGGYAYRPSPYAPGSQFRGVYYRQSPMDSWRLYRVCYGSEQAGYVARQLSYMGYEAFAQ